MKNCPFCHEEIQDDAIKCRFCGKWLHLESGVKQSDDVELSSPQLHLIFSQFGQRALATLIDGHLAEENFHNLMDITPTGFFIKLRMHLTK